MSTELIVKQCAPTLAGLKVGSIFNCSYDTQEALEQEIFAFNKRYNKKGVYMRILRTTGDRALIYLFRVRELLKVLNDPRANALLKQYKYDKMTLEDCIGHLASRIDTGEEFPHEIGIFLGYPVKDVIAFIEHKGKHSKYVGYWKVYYNEKDAKQLFKKYRACTVSYLEHFQQTQEFDSLVIAL